MSNKLYPDILYFMKVLFVSSANKIGISPNVRSQGEALKKHGVDVEYFGIKGKLLGGYPAAIFELRKEIRKFKPNVIHAHFSVSGYVAFLARSNPLVITLMGSDIMRFFWDRHILRFLHKIKPGFKLIVQSKEMNRLIDIADVSILPNGIDLDVFKPLNKTDSRKLLGWNPDKKHILFASSPMRYEKNYPLAVNAIQLLKDSSVELHQLDNIEHEKVPIILNASDVILLTSHREGSPLVIKEAMACNKPVAATNVGDISWLFDNEPGYFITDFNPENVAEKLLDAINYIKENEQTHGRDRIITLGLDSDSFATKLTKIYRSTIVN
jgi:teichuronic acid biosynthesis glycosyltransferase TuaC